MSRLRLVAATSWLNLARSQAYVECIEIGWYLSMSYILCVSFSRKIFALFLPLVV